MQKIEMIEKIIQMKNRDFNKLAVIIAGELPVDKCAEILLRFMKNNDLSYDELFYVNS